LQVWLPTLRKLEAEVYFFGPLLPVLHVLGPLLRRVLDQCFALVGYSEPITLKASRRVNCANLRSYLGKTMT
jgi:hypothetical protein